MNNHIELLSYLADNYNGQIHISTGMTYKKELEKIKKLFKKRNKLMVLLFTHVHQDIQLRQKRVCLLEIYNHKIF